MVPPIVLPSDLPIMVDDRELPGGRVAVILCHRVHYSGIQAAPHSVQLGSMLMQHFSTDGACTRHEVAWRPLNGPADLDELVRGHS